MQPTKELIDELFWDKVRQARSMTPTEKLLAGPELFERACRLAMAGLRHRFPEADENAIEKMHDRQLYILHQLESRT